MEIKKYGLDFENVEHCQYAQKVLKDIEIKSINTKRAKGKHMFTAL